MSYRRTSDFVATDYRYRDPRGGFFGNVFRAVTHVVGGAITGFLGGGGPAGAIVGAVGGAVSGTAANIHADATEALGGSSAGTPAIAKLPPPPSMGATAGVVTMSPLGTPVSPAALARQEGALSGRHRGTHLNKSWSYRRKTGQLIAPHTTQVANRRMNWANGRALSRAERRISRFVHHATRYIRWMHPHKRGRAFPKFHRRKKAA